MSIVLCSIHQCPLFERLGVSVQISLPYSNTYSTVARNSRTFMLLFILEFHIFFSLLQALQLLKLYLNNCQHVLKGTVHLHNDDFTYEGYYGISLKNNINNSRIGKSATSKKVYKVDSNNETILNTWESIVKASIAEKCYESLYTLACDKFGSRVVDSMWKTNNPEIQTKLQACLRKDKSRLESDLYGRIILYNCGVKQHVNKMKEIELQQKERKRKAFADILEKKTEEPVMKKEKKVKNSMMFFLLTFVYFALPCILFHIFTWVY